MGSLEGIEYNRMGNRSQVMSFAGPIPIMRPLTIRSIVNGEAIFVGEEVLGS
jgi:hypothetical protein